MSEVTLEIGRRRYTLTCDAGQEEHVRAMGLEIDARLRRLGSNLSVNDAKNILFAALMLADELHEERQKKAAPVSQGTAAEAQARIAELEERLSDAEDEGERLRLHLANANTRLKELNASRAAAPQDEDELAGQLEALAEKLEKSASLLEGARTTH